MSTGLSSRLASTHPLVRDVLASGGVSYSFEFFPPKDAEGEARLWQAIRELEPLGPSFVSVTYGAGGSTRDHTVQITERIAEETTLTPVGHLTCVGHSVDELRGVIGRYADAGVRNILALRGDPLGGANVEWVRHPEGFDHADDLVRLVRTLGDFCVGVAAFSQGHPESASLVGDAEVLAGKAEAGAEFAITQLFFTLDEYLALVDRVRRLGCRLPIVPGIMPITSVQQIKRFAELSQVSVPAHIAEELTALAEPSKVRGRGVELATQLCSDLLAHGAPGLHFYTLNRSTATRDIFGNLPDPDRSCGDRC
jgi:methylenetetrahydrofolate reductase (NADPH)